MLRHLSKVRIEFNPLDRRSAAALEFLAECNSRKSRDSNPKCEVVARRRTDSHPPFIQVTYSNGKEETIDAAAMVAQQIRKKVLKDSEGLEIEGMFKDAGLKWPPEISASTSKK
eukprot:TRINITY_DN9256_c0_g1_i1.p1 TRINITY_DN9256_c0_g1~~TRINITY_DN9256_c0_g1_i1.p1  ORF type:complete len:114 (-),score=26.11 TRINITY_DN9256_c0_g1_i1:514-855(-)